MQKPVFILCMCILLYCGCVSGGMKDTGEIAAVPGQNDTFSVFLDSFLMNIESENRSAVMKNISFPVEVSVCEEGDCRNEKVIRNDFRIELLNYSKPFMFGPELTGNRGVYEYSYGYEGSQYTLIFRNLDGEWFLVRIKKVSC